MLGASPSALPCPALPDPDPDPDPDPYHPVPTPIFHPPARSLPLVISHITPPPGLQDMGRSSKFAFPLPGRRAQARREATDPPVLPPTIPQLPDPLVPDFAPSPKARRLLGTQSSDCSTPGPANGASPLQRAVSPSLDSKRSYMSITVSDASQSSTSAYKTSTTVPPDPEIVQYAARVYPVAPEEPAPDPQSSNHAARLRSKRSRLGLGTHYDPTKAPLSVSQQTSASAIAHGGLRRGHLRSHSSPNSLYHQSDDEEPTALPKDTDHHPSAMDTPTRRKASPKIDLSRLFNKPSKSKESGADPMLSPTKIVTSPTSLSTNSLQFYIPEATLKPQQEMTMTGAGSNGLRAESRLHAETFVPAEPRAPVSQPAARVYQDACETAKIHVRRPPPGIQHWFDGLGESDDDDDDDDDDHDHVEFEDESESEWPLGEDVAKSTEAKSHTTYRPYRPPELGVEQFYNDKRSGTPSQKSIRSSRSDSRLNVRARSKSRSRSRPRSKLSVRSRSRSRSKPRSREALDELHLGSSPLKISKTLSPPKMKQRPSMRRSNSSKLTHTDLKGTSVLSLSSSSSDDSESGASSADMPNIRESLSILTDADKDVEIQVGRARALEVSRPRQSLEHIRRASESPSECSARGSTTTATIDVTLAPSALSSATSTEFPRRAPSTHRPNYPRQLSTVEDAEEGRGSFYDASNNSSEPEKATQQPANTSEEADAPKRKLMAVTREEQMLLELMRRKRASMAKQNFTDGYNTALKLEHQRGIIAPLVEEFHKNSGRRTSEQGLQPGPYHGTGYRHNRTQSLSSNKVFPERTSSLRPSGEFLPSTVYKPTHPKHEYRSTSSSISGTLASLNRISYESNANMPSLATKAMLPFRESRPPQLPLNIFSPLDLFSPYSPSVMTTTSVNDSALPSPRSPNPVFDSSFRESKALTALCDSVTQNQDEFQSIPLTSSDPTQEKNGSAERLENQPRERPARSSHSRRKSRDQSPPKFSHVLARQPSFTYATAGLQRPTHPIWHHRNASRETLGSRFAVANPYNQSQTQTQTQTLAVPSHRRSSQPASRPQSQTYSSDGRPSTASPDSMLSTSTSTATMTTLSDSAAHAISGPPGAIANGKPTVPVRLRTGSSTATPNTTTSSSTARHSNTPNFSQKLVGSNVPSCRTSSASGSGSGGDRSSSSIDAASHRPRSSVGTAKSLRSSGSGVAITTTLEEGQDAVAYGLYGLSLDERSEGDRTSVCEDVYAAWNSLGGGRAGLF